MIDLAVPYNSLKVVELVVVLAERAKIVNVAANAAWALSVVVLFFLSRCHDDDSDTRQACDREDKTDEHGE